ncbi:hypothetical protein M0805_006980 [Coniferiporia weirii]|nr:hypothetical protein M0805_006980 [Coniferiporia weirii]
MLRQPWRIAAASAATVGSSAYVYHVYTRPARPARAESFELPVRSGLVGPDGKRTYTTQTIPLLPMSEVDARITRLATLQTHPRPGGIIWKHATAQLASNDPIEDAHAAFITERDPAPGAHGSDGDYLFFAVMDGHGGPHTSRLLSKTLISAVALQLHQLAKDPGAFPPERGSSYSFFDSIRSLIGSAPVPKPSASLGRPSDASPAYVSLAIQTAFAMVDAEIVGAPLRLIAEHLAQSKSKSNDPIDLSQHPMALPSMLPALSGSCAILALLDTAHRDLYVACTGDCRAVAGVWEEAPDGSGVWRVEVLSEDQTGRNPNELKRLQSEHPKDEANTVVQRGRILGGLEPSRAFGDSRYKWPLQVQQLLTRVFLDGNKHPMRRPPPDLKTPPYVTAQPVITHHKLDFLPLSPSLAAGASESATAPPLSSSSPSNISAPSLPSPPSSAIPQTPSEAQPAPRPALRFLILATDGLWDQLSSRDAVALVGGHLAGLRAPAVSRSTLAARAPTRLGAAGVEGKVKSSAEEGHPWAFVDANPSAHLIRNAFGGGDVSHLRQLLSIPAPLSRRYRDDVTVTVVWWEDGRPAETRRETLKLDVGDVVGQGAVRAKAKL